MARCNVFFKKPENKRFILKMKTLARTTPDANLLPITGSISTSVEGDQIFSDTISGADCEERRLSRGRRAVAGTGFPARRGRGTPAGEGDPQGGGRGSGRRERARTFVPVMGSHAPGGVSLTFPSRRKLVRGRTPQGRRRSWGSFRDPAGHALCLARATHRVSRRRTSLLGGAGSLGTFPPASSEDGL